MTEKKKHKKVILIVALCILIFASLVIWRTFFHISSDYRIAAERAVEFADEVLDGDVLALTAVASSTEDEIVFAAELELRGDITTETEAANLRERYDTLFNRISNPISRSEHDLAQLFIHFVGDVGRLARAEQRYVTFRVPRGLDPSQHYLYEKSEEERLLDRANINERRDRLLDIRNQIAEIVGIEQRDLFEVLE